ncbi:alcohol dehydrogenase [Mycena floridula]|nr:alcohol dehydrogenase [Mycena floridula]
MAPVRNARLIFKQIPEGYPVPGKTTVYDDTPTIDLETVALDRGILLKTLCLSIDPTIRGKMGRGVYVIDKPVTNFGLALVLRSENDRFKAGDHVEGIISFEQYSVVPDPPKALRVIKNEVNLPWSLYVGVLGMPGKTAYYGWKEYANPKKGEVLFVTTGAGPVGALVIQLAKLDGLKVIGSAGSEEKVQFMKSLGADVAFNYKTTDTAAVLAKEGPVDIYWDHVGGEVLDAALFHAANHARFIITGQIAGYNSANGLPIKNIGLIIYKQINLYGHFILGLEEKYHEAFEREMPLLFKNGTLKYSEHITKGLGSAGEAILAQQQGLNNGKSIVTVAEN